MPNMGISPLTCADCRLNLASKSSVGDNVLPTHNDILAHLAPCHCGKAVNLCTAQYAAQWSAFQFGLVNCRQCRLGFHRLHRRWCIAVT
jgi:hypothetical protein